MLRTYVRTVHKKIEIQKSVKNPYSGYRGESGIYMTRIEKMVGAYPELVLVRLLVLDIKVR